MKIPKKITPDNLKDTVVEIRFISTLPKELMLGFIYQILGEDYKYIPVPQNQTQGLNITLGDQNKSIALGLSGSGFFVDKNNKIKIQFLDNIIIFNSLGNYIGWELYFELIKSVVNKLYTHKFIQEFIRISIRYISQFDNTSIFNNIKGTISFEDKFSLNNSILRFENISENVKTFITLTNLTKLVNKQAKQNIFTSLVDINIFENFEPHITELNLLFDKINTIHIKQKESFFSLISESFLKSLNPEY